MTGHAWDAHGNLVVWLPKGRGISSVVVPARVIDDRKHSKREVLDVVLREVASAMKDPA